MGNDTRYKYDERKMQSTSVLYLKRMEIRQIARAVIKIFVKICLSKQNKMNTESRRKGTALIRKINLN